MHKILRNIMLGLFSSLILFAGVACTTDGDGEQPSAQEKEGENRQENLEGLVDKQPALKMDFSPTRETVNFWMETWDEPGKLAYVYLSAADGNLVGYYVLEGLPVSYCVGITQPYDIIELPTKGGSGRTTNGAAVAAPGMDGAYYGGCNDRTYYGKDATTGSYIEYTVGMGQNVFLYDQPLPRQDVEPLGYTFVNESGEPQPLR